MTSPPRVAVLARAALADPDNPCNEIFLLAQARLISPDQLRTVTGTAALNPAEFDDGQLVPWAVLDRLLCDADIARVVIGFESQLLDVGRTHHTVVPDRGIEVHWKPGLGWRFTDRNGQLLNPD